MSNAKILIGYADMNAAIWWCKWKFLVMQVSFMLMQMRMYMLVTYMLVMHGFAPAWYCGCKCNQMMVQMENSLFCKCFAERCICECYACDANVWTNTHGSSKIHCSIFIQKQVILFNLEFQWSSSGILSSKINPVFRKV